jgi:predicted phosphodiesterase
MPVRPALDRSGTATTPRVRLKQLGRRAFLSHGALLLVAGNQLSHRATACAAEAADAVEAADEITRFGLVTDLHYADKDAAGTRHYRRSPAKLAEAAQRLTPHQPDFVVELGDFIDTAETVELETEFLRTIHKQFEQLPGDKHYVLGNHCVYGLTKGEFLKVVGRERTYYAFDAKHCHCIVLDACYRDDEQSYGRKNFDWTNSCIPSEELHWLQDDLARAHRPTVVFVHQRLDVGDSYGVKNAPAVREVLERSGKVLAVFQGHFHVNDYREINGVHYVTVHAMVEGASDEDSAYAAVEVHRQGRVRVTGFRKQNSYQIGS